MFDIGLRSPCPKGTARFTDIASGISKTDARQLLRGGSVEGLTSGQTQTILRKLAKGRADSISIRTVGSSGNARLVLERADAENGFQRFSFEILPSGEIKRVVQTAFDDAGNLVRHRAGVIFDVKQ